MGRQPDARRKAELLDAVVDYLLRNGLSDLTLRPLAEALGTNARMLIYYFGSREELITEALQAARRRQQQMLQEWAAQGTDQPAADRFRRFWGWLSSKEMEPYVRLFFDVQIYALRRQVESHALLTGVVDDWVTFVQADLERQGVPRERAQATGTLLVAATRGLLLDLLSTGDRERVDRTFALLVWQLTTTTMTGRP